jgi:hypothetical protein
MNPNLEIRYLKKLLIKGLKKLTLTAADDKPHFG